MKMKKIVSIVLAAAMTASLAVGCRSDSSPESNGDNSGREQVKLTALICQSRNYEGLQKMIQKLEEEENIVIEAQVVPDDQYTTLVKTKVNTGEAPDLIDYNIPTVYGELDPAEFFVDLSEESWVSDLKSPENVQHSDGKIYGYPFQSIQGVLAWTYNKDVFEEAGVEVPTNWDEFLQVCETLKQQGITAIHMPKDSWVPQTIMSANFATALGTEKAEEVGAQLESNELKWTEVPEFTEVLDKYLELFEKGYVNEDFTSATYDDTIEAVGTGKAAMAHVGDFFSASVMEAFPDANLGMFNANMIGANDMISATKVSTGFMISKDSKNIDAAKKVFELWSTPEYGNLYYEDRPGFPALNGIDGGETPEYLADIQAQYIDSNKMDVEFNNCLTIGNSVVSSNLWLYYLDAPAKGDMDGAAVLEKFQSDWEKYMAENKQPGF